MQNSMDRIAAESAKKSAPDRRPLKETLWNLLGMILYAVVAVGAVYHLVIEKLK